MNRELEELEQEELDKELIGVGPSTEELPEVPTGEIKEPAAVSEKKKGNLTHRSVHIWEKSRKFSHEFCLIYCSSTETG